MEWWAIGLGAALAGLSFFLERNGKCKHVPEVAGVINGATLAIISLDPVAASAAAALLTGMLLAEELKGRGDYLALATYILIFVMLNEYVYLVPSTIIAAAVLADWKLKEKKGLLGKRLLTHVAAASTAPLVGWTALYVTLTYDGVYRAARLIDRGS